MRGTVTVVDARGAPLPGAVVYITWTVPGGNATNQTATANSNGAAIFTAKGKRGTDALTVNDITKSGYMFDSANSVLSRSITK